MNIEQILGAAGSIGGTVLANSNPVGTFLGLSNPVAGAIVSGLGSLFGSSGSNKDSLKNQKELAAYQSQLEQEKWLERFNLQNEYNLPSAARKRIEDAGLNPNLMYGSLSGNLAAANPSSGTPSGQLSKYMAVQEAMQFNKQLEVSDSVVQKNKEEADLARARARRERVLTESDELDVGIKTQSFDALTKLPQAELERKWKEMDIWDKQYTLSEKIYELDREYKEYYAQLDGAKLDLEMWRTDNEISLAYMNFALHERMTNSQIMVNQATISNLQKLGALYEVQKDGVVLDNERASQLLHGGLKNVKLHGKKYKFLSWNQINNYLDVFGKDAKIQADKSAAENNAQWVNLIGTLSNAVLIGAFAFGTQKFGGPKSSGPSPTYYKSIGPKKSSNGIRLP